VTDDHFASPRWQRYLACTMTFLPCAGSLLVAWLTPPELRDLKGPLGLPLKIWQLLPVVVGGLMTGLMWLFQVKVMTLVVTDSGVTLYRVWKLRWAEVSAARLRNIFGLRYLQVARATGFPRTLSLPLYFVGPRPLTEVLSERTAVGSPIRIALNQAGEP